MIRQRLSQRLIVGLLLIVSSCASMDGGTGRVGMLVPDARLLTADRRETRLAALRGSVVVLDFWASWCPPCRASLPHVNALGNDPARAERGLKVFAVNFGESSADATAWAQRNHLSMPVVIDENGALAERFGVRSLPTTFVIGRDGKIIAVFTEFVGPTSERALDAAIDQALGEPVP